MNNPKVLLAYRDDDGNYHGEFVKTIKEGKYFRIQSIPFYCENIACNDLVGVEEKMGMLFFDKLVEESGHSVVQMIVFEEKDVPKIGKELTKRRCNWVVGEEKDLIAIDIPKEVSYAPIKKWLITGLEKDRWDYKEACLAHTY